MSVVVIAQAWRTAAGHVVDDVMEQLWTGTPAHHRAQGLPVNVVGSVEGSPPAARTDRFVRRMGAWCLHAAQEAWMTSGIRAGERAGVYLGYGGVRAHWDDLMPALQHQTDGVTLLWERGLRTLHPYWMLNNLSNNVHALAAQALGITGEGMTTGGANAGAVALCQAIRALETRAVDAALVMAHDSLVAPEVVLDMCGRGILNTSADVAGPYDVASAGGVAGEAAAALVLVRQEDAPAGMRVQGVTSAVAGEPHEGIARLLQRLPTHRDVVDGMGAAQRLTDDGERAALGGSSPLTSLQSLLGNTGAASALLQVIAVGQSLRLGRLMPVAKLRNVAPGPLRPVVKAAAFTGRSALCLSSGSPGLVSAIHLEVP